MRAFGGVRHLASRFRASVRARKPGIAEQRFAARFLRPAEEGLFWSQPAADLSHAMATARRVAAERPGDAALVRAALLHDVGKTAARLGVVGRTAATLAGVARLPVGRRARAYLAHGEIGARMLEAAGSDALTVAFARHHRSPDPPGGVDPEAWAILRRADHEA